MATDFIKFHFCQNEHWCKNIVLHENLKKKGSPKNSPAKIFGFQCERKIFKLCCKCKCKKLFIEWFKFCFYMAQSNTSVSSTRIILFKIRDELFCWFLKSCWCDVISLTLNPNFLAGTWKIHRRYIPKFWCMFLIWQNLSIGFLV